jgi:hypothetical protein
VPLCISRGFLTHFPFTGSKDEDFCQTCRIPIIQNGSLAGKSIFSYT